MPESDLELLHRAALAAGEVATTYVGGALDIRDKPAGAGPVTEADLAVNAVLEEMLRQARPDYGWLSEESPDGDARLGREAVFVIDPIDGTRAFIDGQDSWAHSLAVVRGGQVSAAAIYVPMRDMLFTAAPGGGARLNGAPIAVSEVPRCAAAEVLVTRPNLDPAHWPGGVPGFRRAHRPSLAYRMGLVAKGRFDGMLTFRRSWEWDVAAGALILAEAGAVVTDGQGAPLRFNNPEPLLPGIIAAGPALHADLMAYRQAGVTGSA